TGFTVSGGFNPQGSIVGTPVAPALCDGGTTTVTYTVTDECGNGSVTATFAIIAPEAVAVTGPENADLNSCDYADQTALDAAFSTWIGQFAVTEDGCGITTPDLSNYTAPVLCTGGEVSVTYEIADLCTTAGITRTFTLTAPVAVAVAGPENADLNSCAYADQAALDAAFTAWIGQFEVTEEGCGVTAPDLSAYTAPVLCEGGEVSITYGVADLCSNASITRTFTVTSPADLSITAPVAYSAAATDFANQAAIDAAFSTWLTGFGVTGGCDPQGSYGTPTAPTLCGGETTVTYDVTDLCETESVSATFTIVSPNELVINKPEDFTASSCIYADQTALNTAFTSWLTGFTVSGGFNPQGLIVGTPVAPALC
ncbi:hypothetical protein, partial [Candidatus Chloroploca sp. Khr17]|uniref:hypothetical protein n=1 Tax=Candidatus Chloroploca sp. Khr17 TaxID=2496869 RepID=UPI0013EB4F95